MLHKEEVFRKLDENRHKVLNDKELTEMQDFQNNQRPMIRKRSLLTLIFEFNRITKDHRLKIQGLKEDKRVGNTK